MNKEKYEKVIKKLIKLYYDKPNTYVSVKEVSLSCDVSITIVNEVITLLKGKKPLGYKQFKLSYEDVLTLEHIINESVTTHNSYGTAIIGIVAIFITFFGIMFAILTSDINVGLQTLYILLLSAALYYIMYLIDKNNTLK